jgi:drug/metabolite transporter (DMT)-like permease
MVQKKNKHVQQLIGVGCVNLATFAWATNMVLGRWLKDSIGPITLSAARFIVASMLFAIILRSLPKEEQQIKNELWLLIAMALTGVVLFSPILYWGLHYTTAVNSTLINGLSPLVTGMLAAWMVREKPSMRQVVGAVLAFLGVVFLISGGSLVFWGSSHFNVGDFIILISVFVWGFYSVFSGKVMHSRSPLSATALSTIIGTPVLCVFALLELQSIPIQLDSNGILAVIYVGIVPAALGFYLWNAGVERLGATGATVFLNTLPLYGALLGFLFLGEEIGLAHILGGLLIISGGVVGAWKRT